MASKLKFLFTISTWLSNVHTWAIFFLWHLTNMSCMVPFWASTDSGSVPIWGPRLKPCRPEEVVYILNDSCSHFTQRLFPPRVPQHTQILFLTAHTYIEYHSYLLHITFIRTFTSLFTRLAHNFTSSDLPGRLAAHGFLCLLQYILYIPSTGSRAAVTKASWNCLYLGYLLYIPSTGQKAAPA